MTSRQNHPLPTPPGGSQQYAQSYAQGSQGGYAPNYQQNYQAYQQAPAQQQQPPAPPMHSAQQKPRPKSRALSFRSDKSGKSGGSTHPKVDMHETSTEKEANRLHSKADPTLAMNEAEPSTVQANVKNQLGSLRDMQHKDPYGNPIAEPDRANPTRSRWERPLDTIRGFEAAIDGGYNRKSMLRSDAESVANWNRRSSYYGNNSARFPQESYYGSRATPPRAESQYDLRQGGPVARDSYYDPQTGGASYPPHPPNPPMHGAPRFSRMGSEPLPQGYGGRPEQQAVYPIPSNHRSYETVASASGSGTSAEPVGYQTDPTSSDNSSIERMQPPPKRQPDPANDYGIAFAQTTTYQPPAFNIGANGSAAGGPPMAPSQNQNGGSYAYSSNPPVPQKDRNLVARRPTHSASNDQLQARPSVGDKRKSWFSRRFSKQA